MKKILLSLLTFALLMPLSITSAEEVISTEENNTFYVHDLSLDISTAQEQTIKASKNNKIKFDLTSMDVSAANISLQANLNDEPIQFAGTLKRTYVSPDKIVVGELNETSGKYEVIHFSINRSVNEFVSVLGNEQKTPTINLYLKEKGTRNFIFTEIQVPSNFDLSDLFDRTNTFEQFDSADLLWYKKVVEPTSISQKEIIPPKDGMTAQASVVKEIKSRKNYALSYNWQGSNMVDFLTLDHIISYDSQNPGEYMAGTVEVITSYTYDYTNNQRVAEGGTADVKNIRAGFSLTSGKIYSITGVGGRYTSGSGNIRINLSVSGSTYIPGVGFEINYDAPKSYTTYPILVNKPSIRVDVNSSHYLFSPGQHSMTTMRISHAGPTTLYAKFQYTMTNGVTSLPGQSNMSFSFS